MSILERRFDGRFLCADLVSVTWSEAANDEGAGLVNGSNICGTKTTCAVLEDISAVGACVQLEQPVPHGASISMVLGKFRFSGRVSYTVFRDDGYFVGIRFADGTAWSAEMVTPQHLTNLESLTAQTDHQG